MRTLRIVLFLLIGITACGERKTPTMELKTQATPSQAAPAAPAGKAASAPAPSQPAPANDGKKLSQAELEKILSPIALYPDPLLAQILPASTYPMEVIEAARLIKSDADLNLIDGQSWDPSVKAVAHYPSVLQLMNANITWMQQLGQAVINQQQDVLAAIQTLRAQAQKQGNLKTTSQQVVQTAQDKIEILPPTPQVIYVPTYDPAVVYTTPAPVVAPLISFGAGVAMGAWLGGGFYWPSNTIVWHSGYWGNTYWNNGNWNHGWNNVNVNNYNHNDYNWNNSSWNHDTNYDNNWNHNTYNDNNYNHDNYNDNRSMFSQNSNLSASDAQKQNTQNFENAMKDQPKSGGDTGDRQNNLGGEDHNADRSNLGSTDRSNFGGGDRSSFGGDHDSWGGSHDSGGLFGGGGDGDRTMDDSMRGFQSRGGGGGFGGYSGFGGGRDFGGGGGFGGGGFHGGGGGFRRR